MTNRLVLIVDDDPAVRRLLRRILRAEFSVVEAGDGLEAFDVARAERPALVLLDLEMPRLDGHGALLRFRADPSLRTTPVLIVTGAATGGADAAMFLRDGAHDFVRKPFDEVELTARVRAAHRHKALEDALRSRNRELDAFASFAAHDLKSPLAAIASIADLLTGPGYRLDDDQRREFLEDIGRLALQGSRLVADLLALAREDWAGTVMDDLATDAGAVLAAVIDDARLTDAEVEVTGNWARVAIPEAAIRSVFGNLLSNAAHYGRDEQGRLSCTVTGRPRAAALEVIFQDRGPGVDPTVRRRLFEPFVAGPASVERNPSSTGLGLAVVGRTMERHGGRAELMTVEPGTAFRLLFPLAAV